MVFQTRTRKMIADVLSHKGRTAMVSLSIMIGVFGASLLIGADDILASQIKSDMKPENISMVKQYVVLPQGQLSLEENQAFLEAANQLPHVTNVEGQAFYPVAWHGENSELKPDGTPRYADANLLAFSQDFEATQLEPISELMEGRYPATGQHEVVVDIRFAEANGLEVGDTLTFQPQTPESEPSQWTIVGLVYNPFFLLNATGNGNLEGEYNIFATYADAQSIVNFGGLSAFVATYDTFENAQEFAPDFTAFVAAQTPYVPVFQFVEDPEQTFIMTVVSDVINVLNTLAIVAMVVSGLLVVNVINTIVVEQKQQIGVLKSLGASRWDTFFIFAGIAFIYGVIGSTLGVLLAIPAAAYMASSLGSDALTYIDGFRISPIGVGVGLGMGLLVPVVVSIIPVFNGTRVSILSAINDFGIASNWGHGWKARLINALPLPLSIRQAFSNIAQKQGRLMLTGAVLTLAIASFMGVTAMLTTINDQIDNFFSNIGYDITVSPQNAQDFASVETLLTSQISDVEAVYPGYAVSGYLEGYEAEDDVVAGTNQIFVIGIDSASNIFNFDLVSGEGWENDPTREGVMLTNPIAEQLSAKAGDSVTLTVNGETRQLEILGVIDSASYDLFYRWDQLAIWAGYVDAAGSPLTNRFYVDMMGDDLSINAVDDHIEAIHAVLMANGIQASYTNQPRNAEENSEGLIVFAIIFYIMAGVMAAVGAVGLLAVLSMAVFERQKEIGVMRSIGARSTTILSQFLAEGLLIALVAWMIALPISYVFGGALMSTLPFDGVYFSYPVIVVLYGFVGSMAVAMIASLSPAWAASRKTVSDILRYQ